MESNFTDRVGLFDPDRRPSSQSRRVELPALLCKVLHPAAPLASGCRPRAALVCGLVQREESNSISDQARRPRRPRHPVIAVAPAPRFERESSESAGWGGCRRVTPCGVCRRRIEPLGRRSSRVCLTLRPRPQFFGTGFEPSLRSESHNFCQLDDPIKSVASARRESNSRFPLIVRALCHYCWHCLLVVAVSSRVEPLVLQTNRLSRVSKGGLASRRRVFLLFRERWSITLKCAAGFEPRSLSGNRVLFGHQSF